MANFLYFWKVYLRPYMLSKDGDKYQADVVYNGPSLRPADLAHLLWEEGSEVHEETILSIIQRSENIIRRKVLEGNCVVMPNYQMAPRVRGLWDNLMSLFDPRKHIRSLDLFPSSDMRRELEKVGVEVLGLRSATRIGITRVTNAGTGETDGRITPGEDVVLEGERLKVTIGDPDAGVFFLSEADGSEYRVTHRLTQNFPTSVIARVPATLPPGEYRVVIRTRFTPGGKYAQKELQEIDYARPLRVLEERPSTEVHSVGQPSPGACETLNRGPTSPG